MSSTMERTDAKIGRSTKNQENTRAPRQFAAGGGALGEPSRLGAPLTEEFGALADESGAPLTPPLGCFSAPGSTSAGSGTSFGLNDLEAVLTVAYEANEWIAAHVLKAPSRFFGRSPVVLGFSRNLYFLLS